MAATPVLKRFDTYIYRVFSAGDDTIIPVQGAVLRFYAQGATATQTKEIFGLDVSVAFNVYHAGTFAVGDLLFAEGNPPGVNAIATVNSIDVSGAQPLLRITNAFPDQGSFYVYAGKRLIERSKVVGIHADPLGGDSAIELLSTGVDGRAVGYVSPLRFDYTVTLDTGDLIVFADADGSFVMRT